MFDKLIEILKANPRKIVFTEGPDARILEAAARLKEGGFLTPVLVGNVDEVKAAAAKGGFDKNPWTVKAVETDGKNEQHVGVMNAFAARILHGEPLVAEGAEGINGLTISNAAFLSSWLDETVTLPIDEDLFYEKLQEKIRNSTHKKVVVEQVQADMSSTF